MNAILSGGTFKFQTRKNRIMLSDRPWRALLWSPGTFFLARHTLVSHVAIRLDAADAQPIAG